MGIFLFKLRQVVLFWLAPWFFGSGARDLPTSAGKEFVFSYYSGTFAKVYFGTKAVGNVKYKLTCMRNCGEKLTTQQGAFKFPQSESLLFPVCKGPPDISGKQLPVLVLKASSAIYVTLVLLKSSESIACTYLLPVQVAAKSYLYLTPYQKGRMMILSLDYSRTIVKVNLKDNIAYMTDRPTNIFESREQNDPQFRFQSGLPESMRVKVDEWTDITLGHYECYYLEVINSYSDLSGAQITSDNPILILQGSNEQAGFRNDSKSEIFMDSLAPVETFGTLYAIPFSIGEEGEVKVITTGGGEVTIQILSDISVLVLWQASDWVDFSVDNTTGPVFVMSMRPINVLQTILSTDQVEYDVSCMRSVDPVERWAKSYAWINPQTVGGDILIHFTTILIESGHDYEGDVIVNNEVPQVIWESISSTIGPCKSYSLARLTVGPGPYEVYVRDHPAVVFLVTLSAFIEKAGYCTAASAIFPRINSLSAICNTTDVEPGDLLDNDCDGRYDEEVRNGEDDDGDKRVDEDLQPDKRVNGKWGEWSGYQCHGSCGRVNGISMRRRKCDNPPVSGSGDPCIGDNEIIKRPPECVLDYVKCPSECKAKEWGYNCSKTCENCLEECTTDSGICNKCAEGFTSIFCNESCPEFCKACDITSTKCVSCERGLLGPLCDEACPKTFFGAACALKCSSLCMDADCDGKSGDCLQCPDGKWGTDCTKTCLLDCITCWKHNGKCEQNTSNGSLYAVVFLLVMATLLGLICCMVKPDSLQSAREEYYDAEGDMSQLGEEGEQLSEDGEDTGTRLGDGEETQSGFREEKESGDGEEQETEDGEEKETGDGEEPPGEDVEEPQDKKSEEDQGIEQEEKEKNDTTETLKGEKTDSQNQLENKESEH